jgi:uncharacterized damage-inducible protein DinB
MDVESLFLKFSVDKLRQFAERIEVCLGNLNEDQIRQWIISSLGDDPDSRDRDSEFASRGGINGTELTRNLRTTVERASQIISGLNTAQLTRMYEIQQYPVSGVEIVYHVVEHFAQHTGQIIFATKMLTGEDLGFYRHLSEPAHGEHVP